ncbi:hypothetical protein BDF22DRAFT_694245 [Syncephalis plumigaleata]|nr:hypothetical protein BDF22DRAFT_694245 [Syncephalis plumigaleata]
MKTIGELCCENVQLKEQLVMAKETIKEQASCISLLEEERSQHQQEMNNIMLTTQQQLLDHATKQSEINDMTKQLCQAQERHVKVEEKLRQRQLELDNRTKEVEQQERNLDNRANEVEQQEEELDERTEEVKHQEETLNNRMGEVALQRIKLDNRKKELDTREHRLSEEQVTRNLQHIAERVKLNTRIDKYSTKQKEYDALIDVLSHALSDYGKQANYAVEETNRNRSEVNHCRWTAMRQHLDANYTSIRQYLYSNLKNSVSREKKLKDTIVVYKYY